MFMVPQCRVYKNICEYMANKYLVNTLQSLFVASSDNYTQPLIFSGCPPPIMGVPYSFHALIKYIMVSNIVGWQISL